MEDTNKKKYIREKNIIRHVVFDEVTVKGRRGNERRVLKSHGIVGKQKCIELDRTSSQPDPGTAYMVQVIKDTNEHNPLKGKLIVRIIEEEMLSDW